ncbi:MAG: cell division protein ZapE [Pseudomonadota bacterium]
MAADGSEQGGPLRRYRSMVSAGRLTEDPAQETAVAKLDALYARLAERRAAGGTSIWRRFGFGGGAVGSDGAATGLYLWGGVGRGKSMMMDLFFKSAPVAKKRRIHFHEFMQEVHRRLGAQRRRGADERTDGDPVPPVAAAIAQEAQLLCFDELQVTDITDAMIIGRVFQGLFDAGVTMVATSNRHPQDLYKNGLQRDRFLPFIALIQEKLEIHEVDGGADHRLARLRGRTVYHAPLGPAARAAMDAHWDELTAEAEVAPLTLSVQGREVVIDQFANGVARASFSALCGKPLGAADYLALAEASRTLLIDEIPLLGRANNNEAKRFVTLIDALYEARSQLVCSAAAGPDDLYPRGEGAFEFERTASRLWEMQSEEWRRG